VAIELAYRLTGWTHRAIRAYYDGISTAAVTVPHHRFRQAPPAQFHAIELIEKKLKKETTS
jgi:hypothetical protein